MASKHGSFPMNKQSLQELRDKVADGTLTQNYCLCSHVHGVPLTATIWEIYEKGSLDAAVVAERDQLNRLLKEAIEWNWIDFQDEEHKETYPRLSKLASEIQTALEKHHE